MDPLAFDQKFARYVSQVDSEAIRGGSHLYEAGRAAVRFCSLELIRGSVEDPRLGPVQVKLVDNGERSWSGSCDCPDFFNCSHSYALARAARDQVVGKDPAAAARPAKASEAEPQAAFRSALDRLWTQAKRSGYLVYPRELQPFLAVGTSLRLPPREPLREIARLLARQPQVTLEAFAGAIKAYCEAKSLPMDEAFARFAKAPHAAGDGDRSRMSLGERSSSDGIERLELRYELAVEASPDEHWYLVSARPRLSSGSSYSSEEISKLLEANGAPVRLPGRGWKQLFDATSSSRQQSLLDLGLSGLRGNAQRVHASQLQALVEGEAEAELPLWQAMLSQARELKPLEDPTVPAFAQGVLRPYQRDGFVFLAQLSHFGFGGILGDDMGLGKTLQTLTWLAWLKEKQRAIGEGFRCLIVCPKSVMDNWESEAKRFETGLSAAQFDAKRAKDIRSLSQNVWIVNYAQLRLSSELFTAEEWDAVVLDEGQNIKNPNSQTSKTAFQLRSKQRLILSGTPIENSLLDLWSLMRFAVPRLLGPQAVFRANYDLASNPTALECLKRRIRPFFLRRLKSEVAHDLPERIEEDIQCSLDPEQRALYDAELQRARSQVRNLEDADSKGGAINVLQTLLRLRQICCDPRLVGESLGEGESSAKMQALLDIVSPIVAEGHKVLVFSQFVAALDLIESHLAANGISSLKLTGKTANRGQLVERFQNGCEESVFLLSLKAAGSGLTLTAASYVVLFDPWWNPAVEAQAIDRAHRIGQKSTVIAYRILAKNTVEERIRLLQAHKAELADAVMAGEGKLGSLTLETLKELLA